MGDASITISPTSLTTTESGGCAGFTVVLNSEPVASVSIGISSSDSNFSGIDASDVSVTNIDND